MALIPHLVGGEDRPTTYRGKMALQNRKLEVEVVVREIIVKGSPLTASIKSEINSNNVQVIGKGEGQMIATNQIGVARDTFKAMVSGWSNAIDTEGKPIKCTEKTKNDVFEFDPDFVAETVNAINEKVKAIRADEIKN